MEKSLNFTNLDELLKSYESNYGGRFDLFVLTWLGLKPEKVVFWYGQTNIIGNYLYA